MFYKNDNKKRKSWGFPNCITKILDHINPKDEIVLNVYHSMLNSFEQISINSPEDSGQYLLRTFQTNLLLNEIYLRVKDN